MKISKNLKCPTCGMSAEWIWHGTGSAVRFVTVKCPAEHLCLRKTYHVSSENFVTAQLIDQWEEQ